MISGERFAVVYRLTGDSARHQTCQPINITGVTGGITGARHLTFHSTFFDFSSLDF
jgi:hypothetical protein